MKVVFLGAAVSHLCNWLDAFVETGLEVVLVTLHRDRHSKPRFRCIDLSPQVKGKLSYFRALPIIRRTLALENPDLLVSYYASSYGALARLTGFQPRIVVTAGSDINFDPWRQPHLRILTSCALNGARGVVCWSPTMRDRLLALGVSGERIFELPRGIDLAAIPSHRAGFGPLRIVCARRLSPIFNHDVLLRACRTLMDRNVPFVLRLCNTGPELARIQKLAIGLGLQDAVSFLGEISHGDVLKLLADSDVIVSLSSKDGACASLFEAMASGCYPVASRIPANEAWVRNGDNGALVPLDNAASLADVLTHLASNPGERQRAAEVNRRFARNQLDVRVNTSRYRRYFESVAGVGTAELASVTS